MNNLPQPPAGPSALAPRMAAAWPRTRAARRALGWAALSRLRRRVERAGGRAVRFLIQGPLLAPSCSTKEALIQFIAQGGTYSEYRAEALKQLHEGPLLRKIEFERIAHEQGPRA